MSQPPPAAPRPAPSAARQDYLDRLRDLLPPREAGRVLREVESMILDHVEHAEREGSPREVAEREAVASLGSPEALADRIVEDHVRVDLATRRSFARWFGVLFAGHLVLTLVLTLAGADGAPIPGILGPLTRDPWYGFVSGVLSVFLVDLGGLFGIYLLLGIRRSAHAPAFPRLRPAWTPRDSVAALVLLPVLAVVLNPPVRDSVFAVRLAGTLHPLLAPELVAFTVCVNGIIGLHVVRHVVMLARRRMTPLSVALDAGTTLAAVALLVVMATRADFLRLPAALDPATAQTVADLATRLLLLLFVLAAFFLAIRAVRRLMLLRQMLGT